MMLRFGRYTILFFLITISLAQGETVLPEGAAPQAIELPYFPSRMHAFVWRNWPLVDAERLARVLETEPENVRQIAESMGLPPQHPITEKDQNRIYITLIRRNWHLLPYEQLLTLLDRTADELALSLREDDFLFEKLGSLKPHCEPVRYSPPSEEERQRCAAIQKIVQDTFGDELRQPEESRFQFLDTLSRPLTDPLKSTRKSSRFSPRYIYSYFALYGDPLMNPQLDPYPEGLLQRLSDLGVDGVWMHCVLRQLAPSAIFPEFGEGCETRLANLRALVQKAKRYGIGIYLYMNEPRAMPGEFFRNRENLRGVRENNFYTMCTSAPDVRQWLSDSLEYVFKNVPDLAGVFTITASENLSNCASHGQSVQCSRCKDRSPAEIIAEVNATIEAGVHRGNPDATVIAWDWGWSDSWAEEAIAKLPSSVMFMSVSEWSKPIERGGIKTEVGEYSISVVGPGPRASRHWAAAKKAGLKTVAKVQFNNTWELSAVPYLPVLNLIAEHCRNLIDCDVDGLMLSWSLGGYPSPNLQLVQRFEQSPPPTMEEALDTEASACFGPEGAPFARRAWTAFSRAFQEFPYNGSVLYRAPLQYGPSNLLFWKPTGYSATMVGFPYDDVDGWRGPYPVDIFVGQLEKVAQGWKDGLGDLQSAVQKTPAELQGSATDQLRFAEAAQLHFSTVANQTQFTALRNEWLQNASSFTSEQKEKSVQKMEKLVHSEIEIARRLFTLSRQDSRIGYEASNQYYYVPVDLVEKVIDCQYVMDQIKKLQSP